MLLISGIPEIGVPHFEPLSIDRVSVSRGSGSLNLQGGFTNLVVHGPSNTTVRRATLDMEKQRLEFDLDIPKLRVDAQYNLKGQILLLPIVGNGDVAMSLKNVKTTVKTKFSLKNLPEVRQFASRLFAHYFPSSTGSHTHRPNARGICCWHDANSPREPFQRQQGVVGIVKYVP